MNRAGKNQKQASGSPGKKKCDYAGKKWDQKNEFNHEAPIP